MFPQPYILIVDDFVDGREMLAEYLTFRGFDVVSASDGMEALKLAFRRRPRLILMDLTMTGVDGWEATRRLKADPRTKDVIIIAVTAHALQSDEAKARHAGCDAFIAKPYDLAVLADALEKVMHRGRAALASVSAVMLRPNTSRQTRKTIAT